MRVFAILFLALLGACGGSGNSGDGGDGGGLPSGDGPIRPVSNAPFTQEAVSILAPGQSGDFTTAEFTQDQAQGALIGSDPSVYGDHVDDQRLPYWNSEFKDGRFLDVSDLEPQRTFNDGAVRIYRDPFGVPVIHGDTLEDVWFGAGYALAEDRLFLLDGARRQARGTLAEVAGPGSVPADVEARVLTYTEEEYQAMFDALSDDVRRVIQAYCDGSNQRIADVSGDPSTLPAEFVLLDYEPAPLTPTDVMAIGVLITRQVASNGGDEFANVAELQRLAEEFGRDKALEIFSDVLWVDDRKAAVTVPEGQTFSNITTPPAQRAQVLGRMADFALGLPLELAEGPGTGDFPAPSPLLPVRKSAPAWPDLRVLPERISASYQVVVAPERTVDGSTLLVSGPQLGYSYPTLLVEVEVHGGGYDARGSTVAGLPVVGIGYGERTVWGLTTGESKTIDSFIVEVNPDNPEEYFHDGVLKPMDCRDETVNYRSTADGVPNVSEPKPGVNADTIRVCRTVHGPVVARATTADGTPLARAVQYAMWGREIETVNGVQQWNRVDSFAEFFDAMSLVTWNENTMYADADGNIAYFHPGLHPWRHPAADQRFPIPGSGEFDHCGQLAFENTPHSVNPERGYLHNWNNKPALGWGEGVGGDASQEPSGADGRNVNWGQVIRAELDGDGLSIDDLVEMDLRIGRIDPRAAALLPSIMACDGGCGLDAEGQALIDILRGWDRQHYNDAIDVTLEPGSTDDADAAGEPDGVRDTAGATIFDAIATAMVDEITVDVVPTDFITRHSRRGNHPYDAGTFHKLVAKILDPSKTSIPVQHDWLAGRDNEQFVADSIALALTRLKATYGDNTAPADYRRIHARSSVCALAQPLVGPCLSMPHTDRGSWLKIVSFTPAP